MEVAFLFVLLFHPLLPQIFLCAVSAGTAAVRQRKLKCWYRTRTYFSDLLKSTPSCFLFLPVFFHFLAPNVAIVTHTKKPETGNPIFLAMGPKMVVPGKQETHVMRTKGELGKAKAWLFMCFWAPLQVALMSLTLGSKLQTFRIKLQYRSLSRSPGSIYTRQLQRVPQLWEMKVMMKLPHPIERMEFVA